MTSAILVLVVAALTTPQLLVFGDGFEEVPDVESWSMQPEGTEMRDDAVSKEVIDVASSAYDDAASPISLNDASEHATSEELLSVVSYDAAGVDEVAADDAGAPSKAGSTQAGSDDGYEDDFDTAVLGDGSEGGMDVDTPSPMLICDTVHPKYLTACLQSDGKCVASRAQCDELGGAYDADGCGVKCACCARLQPMHAPSRPNPSGGCASEHVPRSDLTACSNRDGYCTDSEAECAEKGGVFDDTGCPAEAKCGCCTDVPSDVSAVAHAGTLPSWETPSPTATKQQVLADAAERPRYSMYLRLASLLVVLSIASNLAPVPTNPLARTLLSPLTLVFDVLKCIFLFLAACCFTFGDGIAEPRPPAPIGMKAMPIRDVAMTERLRRPDVPNSTDALLADAELEDYEVETDEEEGGAAENNPFKKRT